MFPEFSSLGEFILWLVSSQGALVASGFFVAYVLERFEAWHKVAHDLKTLVTVGLAVLISYLAKEYLNVPTVVNNDELNQIFNLFVYYFGNQLAYKRYFKSQ